MLMSLKSVLQYAQSKQIAVASLNVTNLEGISAALEAAQELNLPVIIQFAQVHESLTSFDMLGPVMVLMAERSNCPVCVHLDHGEDFAHLKQALDFGFTSIMYDGSSYPFEENIANTCMAVELAKRYGASVEAEIGSLGREEFESIGAQGEAADSVYTDPAQAKSFVAHTGIDALACSFGTVHGLYLTKPQLDFNRISRIQEQISVPIVMHGGSGICEEDYRECIRRGVRKINYYTYMAKAGAEFVRTKLEKIQEPVYFHDLSNWGKAAMKEDALRALRIFSGM